MTYCVATPRLRLRAPRIDDLTDYLAYRNDPVALSAQTSPPLTEEGARAFLLDQSRLSRDGFGWRMFAIERLERPGLIGEVGLFLDEGDPKQGDLGWWLHQDHRRRGYATEAATALIDWCFAERGLHRLTARCLSTNMASQAIMRAVGMRLEARSIESRLTPDGWRDEVGYAVLKREWRSGSG